MAPGRPKTTRWEGKDPLSHHVVSGLAIGAPLLETPQKGGHLRGHFVPTLWLPFLLTKAVQGGNEQILPGSFGFGGMSSGKL